MFRACKKLWTLRRNSAASLNNKACQPAALARSTFKGVSSTRRHSDIGMCKASATNEKEDSSGFAHLIRCEAKTRSKSPRDGYSDFKLNFSQWRAIVFESTQQATPARFSCSTTPKTFALSRPITERRLIRRPSGSLTLHSCRNASKYSGVPTSPIIANSVMLLGCDSKHERVRRAKLSEGRPYLSISSRPAASECKSMRTPPMSKMTAVITARWPLCKSVIVWRVRIATGDVQHLTRMERAGKPRHGRESPRGRMSWED